MPTLLHRWLAPVVDEFWTVARAATARLEIKRSVFECRIEPVSDEASARAVLDGLRKQHWDARHHCSAFVLGAEGRTERSNDDGEPAGTAGAPMLDVLRGHGLTDVVAVVTRWFGGTLLGAGGLVRAYSDAVREGLAAAGRARHVRVEEWLVALQPGRAGRFEAELRDRGHAVLDVEWGSEVLWTVGVRPDEVPAFLAQVAAATAGEVEPVRAGHRWALTP